MKKLLIVVTIGAFFASCDSAEKEKMKSQLDSLQNELQVSQQMSQTLQEVGTLMDSIDASRQVLRVNMVEGTTYAAYTSRMKTLTTMLRKHNQKSVTLKNLLRNPSQMQTLMQPPLRS
ncbi:MAG: hypothetical protein WDN75_21515 [Bacteroidota bacterium]